MFRLTLQRFQHNVVCNTCVRQIFRRPFSDNNVMVPIDIPIVRRCYFLFILGNVYCVKVFHFIDTQSFNDTFAVYSMLSVLLPIILLLHSIC